MVSHRRLILIVVMLTLTTFRPAAAQPTYKLDVKSEFRPRARLSLDGAKIVRTAVVNDPGFRLQYHIRKDGKTVVTIEARRQPAIESPVKEPGVCTAVLEVFYPAYKGGTLQKGEFRPISNVLTFRVDAGTPPRLTRIVTPPPAAATIAASFPVLLSW